MSKFKNNIVPVPIILLALGCYMLIGYINQPNVKHINNVIDNRTELTNNHIINS